MRSDFTTITPRKGRGAHPGAVPGPTRKSQCHEHTKWASSSGRFSQDMYVDQEDVRVVIVTGRGGKAFSAGRRS
jgi:hypothetical protein